MWITIRQIAHGQQQFPLTLGWKDFTEPRWWSDTHGWLAFVPCEPMLVGFPFDRLARLPQTYTSTSEGKYELLREIVDSWARLDLDLLHVTQRLLGAYRITAIAPYSPWAKGYRGSFKQPHSIKKAAMLS